MTTKRTERAEFPVYSGVYPHLAVTNEGNTECGIGAVVVWAGRLWFNTYAASGYKGDDNKLYTLDSGFRLEARAESVGGTHANRFVHRESGRLVIGMYVVDENGAVLALDPSRMHGRMTGAGRHLTDPANKVYLYSMEDALYEVDIRTLEWNRLARDLNEQGREVPPDRRLPGDHGKGGYTGQRRFVVTHNGIGGALAEWNGAGDPQQPESWIVVDRNKYTDVTGPGCIFGAPDDTAPLWALGWDEGSVLLNVRDAETDRWLRYRLPKSSYAYDADHGWFTEWPRIRDIGAHGMLMDMHGMFFRFPNGFRPGCTAGIAPLSRHLKMVVDFAEWNGRIALAVNDASRFDNPLLGRQQSNLWFRTFDELAALGRPEGWGGVWLRSKVVANEPSEPFLTAGFDRVWLHLAHDAEEPAEYTVEADVAGDGAWRAVAVAVVPAGGYRSLPLPPEATANWLRLVPAKGAGAVTAYFHLSQREATAPDPELIGGLPSADGPAAAHSAGVVRPMERSDMRLQFAAHRVGADGVPEHFGYYEIGGDMKLSKLHDPSAEFQLRRLSMPTTDYGFDAASVVLTDIDGRRYRLPKGSAAYDKSGPAGLPRAYREVVTERSLMNVHGTFYELPRPESGGFRKMKPICTHNRLIYDFCSWRGMLVISGVADDAAGGHCVRSDDGRAALWFGNVDDLWTFGAPAGEGGPCLLAPLKAGEASDPYMMTGFRHKTMELSHAGPGTVAFDVQIDFLGDGDWHSYGRFEAPEGGKATHAFPDGFSAHWVRVVPERDCIATVWLSYK